MGNNKASVPSIRGINKGYSGAVFAKSLLQILIITILFILLFLPIYSALYERFTARDSYYSHGPLIPLISLFLVWRKRKKLKSIEKVSYLPGLFILVFGLLIHMGSIALKFNFGSYVAFIVSLSGLVLFLGGKKVFKEVLFPVVFLMFALPLPKVAIIGITFKMKMFATHISTILINAIGFKVKQVGSTIYYPGGSLVVEDPCSGLRSLITFLSLGTLFTQFTNVSRWKKSILILCTIPIALISNISRIVALLFVSYVYGVKAASGFFHDFAGMMVFVIGFLGFLLTTRLLKCTL